MNDETSGQLCSHWQIPEYAQKLIWVDSEQETTVTEGPAGLFTLTAPAPVITLRWGSPDGAPLTQLNWQPDSLEWNGDIRIGGAVEAIHIREIPGLPDAVMIVTIEGVPLRPTAMPFHPAHLRETSVDREVDYYTGIDGDIRPEITTWLSMLDSPLSTIVQDALLNKNRIHLYGRLAEEKAGFHRVFALPILLEAITLFSI